jgi:hypothetical protein
VGILALSAVAGVRGAIAQGEPQLAIDADAQNGSAPCSPIDATVSRNTGDPLRVAVCLVNGDGVAVAAFNFRLTYDDTLLRAAEVADAGTALDDNPDANAGMMTFSTPNLGGGWDCSAEVGSFPTADEDGLAGNGVGIAYSGGCGSIGGSNTLVAGPLEGRS